MNSYKYKVTKSDRNLWHLYTFYQNRS